MNGVGPDDIAITAATAVDDSFDARRSARSRSYLYRMLARSAPSPFERESLGTQPLRAGPRPLVAAPDRPRGFARPAQRRSPAATTFTAFTPTQTDHVRFERDVLTASWKREGDILEFRITADAFMRNMVRVLVGTMLEAGSDRRTLSSFRAVADDDADAGAPRTGGYAKRRLIRPHLSGRGAPGVALAY